MNRTNLRSGSALTIVLLTVMAVSLLAITALYVTGMGRDVTANYINYTGVYNLAVAGNEYALSIFKDVLKNPKEYENVNTSGNPNAGSDSGENGTVTAENISIETVAGLYLNALIKNKFAEPSTSLGYQLTWTVEITTDIKETFTGNTTVTKSGNDFTATTVVHKTLNGWDSYPATVQLEIKWPQDVKYFDGNKLPVLKSKRI